MIEIIWRGVDSTVYHYPWMDTCYKNYNKGELSDKTIQEYHRIHNLIREILMQSDISDQVEVLHLDANNIWQACSIKNRNKSIVSNIKYVDWERIHKTYDETLSIIWESNLKDDIKTLISENLALANIKSISKSKVVITDLWASILDFIEEYHNIWDTKM